MANRRYGGYTLAPGQSWYYWFSYSEVPWGVDNRTMILTANASPGRGVFLPELWCFKVFDTTNAVPPYNSFNQLVENRSDHAVGFDIMLTTLTG